MQATVYLNQENLSGTRQVSPETVVSGQTDQEAQLIEQARQGDEVAWAKLVTQHQDAVFRLAFLLLGNPDDAQDVAQDALIRAFYALDSFDTTRPLRPWLLRITSNLVSNKRRSIARYLAAVGRWFQKEAVTVEPDFQDSQLKQWEAQTVWQAVQQLSRSDQEIIYLRFFLELSVAETADATGIASGTVKSRLHRALHRLRQVIAQHFPDLQAERMT